ncbi:MAG: hypothetical protein N3F10_03460 [Candidatus Bathyarchaeota archaeon]|nr:hypothetical protein [Candidatus Bathyarchaeota archaeon]MCX8177339.1 hypothetical protein [Candidatus Bathyarchaeota archaeon]MDW8193785.1 hypothetical protein [Nitrososphaerota archaeon]
MKFPERLVTDEEIQKAGEFLKRGYRHRLRVSGSEEFKGKVGDALKLIKEAGFYEYLTAYIKEIVEIDGFTQLREAEAKIWANKYAVQNPVDAASLFIQKAHHMKEYLEGKLYYGGDAERRSVEKRIEFLKALKNKSRNGKVIEECERLLKSWDESVYL